MSRSVWIWYLKGPLFFSLYDRIKKYIVSFFICTLTFGSLTIITSLLHVQRKGSICSVVAQVIHRAQRPNLHSIALDRESDEEIIHSTLDFCRHQHVDCQLPTEAYLGNFSTQPLRLESPLRTVADEELPVSIRQAHNDSVQMTTRCFATIFSLLPVT